jgi:hypothetical protein
MRRDNPAPLRPRTPRLWIVRWVREDGSETRHRIYMTRHAATRFLRALLADGREAAMFSTPVEWERVS